MEPCTNRIRRRNGLVALRDRRPPRWGPPRCASRGPRPHPRHRSVGTEKVLYVADRSNARIVVFSLDGEYLRTLGAGVVNSPSSRVDFHGHLMVTELFGALAVFDGDDYVGHIGASGRDHADADWPNRTDESGQTVAPHVVDGTFNSPTASPRTRVLSTSPNG
jgi:hypothetical protein